MRRSRATPRSPRSDAVPEYDPCGGCGETSPARRCIGCFHPFKKIAGTGEYVDVSSDGTAHIVQPDGTRSPAPEGWDRDDLLKATKLDGGN